jgi:hypothetical protein
MSQGRLDPISTLGLMMICLFEQAEKDNKAFTAERKKPRPLKSDVRFHQG